MYSQSYCRLCAKSFELSSLLHIFNDKKSGTGSLDAYIRRYLPFPISVSDSLTHYICKLCCANVIRWHRFVTLCVKAQTQLKNVEQLSSKASAQENLVNEESATVPSLDVKSLVTKANLESGESVVNIKAKKKKSNYCVARWCNNSNDMGIPFFRVPKDRNRALQWLLAADRMDLADKDVACLYRCYLCATHFTKEMFVNEHGKSLNRNAVPSVFLKPAYALKIEDASRNSNSYPKELQGVRLKNILPKSVQQSREITAQGSLSISLPQESYTQILRVVPESHQKLQEVFLVRDPVPSHSNIHIISMSPAKDDASETVQILQIQDLKDPQVSNIFPKPSSSSSLHEVYESSVKEIQSQAFVCDYMKSETNPVHNESVCNEAVVENPPSSIITQNTVMDFTSNNVPVLDLVQKPPNINEKAAVLVEDQQMTTDSLGLHGLPSEDSLPSNMTIASFSSENPSFLNQDRINFQPKELSNKDGSSHGLGNIVGSQDFLLMHSSSNHIEQARDHGFIQDKNLNNLCGTIVTEPVTGSPVVYAERSMMAEASVRAMECTSPSHGQIIEGLMDLDQFLDSG